MFLIATEDSELIQQEDKTDIAPENWQDAPAVSTTTWTIQEMATKKISDYTAITTPTRSTTFTIDPYSTN